MKIRKFRILSSISSRYDKILLKKNLFKKIIKLIEKKKYKE